MNSDPDGESVEGSPVECQPAGKGSRKISLAKIPEDTAGEL
jgi:hypothetical protein